jgi:hypothetical protein
MKVGEFSKEYILSIPKYINENGCWISNLSPTNTGYVLITIRQKQYYLHRVVLCLWYNLDYNNPKVDTRHNKGCNHACFNPEHLKPGTAMQNTNDSILHGTHANAAKECCSICGGPYTKTTLRRGPQRGKVKRYCRTCRTLTEKKRRKRFRL